MQVAGRGGRRCQVGEMIAVQLYCSNKELGSVAACCFFLALNCLRCFVSMSLELAGAQFEIGRCFSVGTYLPIVHMKYVQ